jgi:hypothetical protein
MTELSAKASVKNLALFSPSLLLKNLLGSLDILSFEKNCVAHLQSMRADKCQKARIKVANKTRVCHSQVLILKT